MTKTEHISTALSHFPGGVDSILVGDINVVLSQTEGRYSDKDIAAIFASEGLEDMAAQFRPQQGGGTAGHGA